MVLSQQERRMMCDAVEKLLSQYWQAPSNFRDHDTQQALTELGQMVSEQGVPALGAADTYGGLRDIIAVLSIFGAHCCPLPLIAQFTINLLISKHVPAEGDLSDLLESSHQGDVRFSMSAMCGVDDAQSSTLSVNGHLLDGEKKFFEGVQLATHLIFPIEKNLWACTDRHQSEVSVVEARGLAEPSWSIARFEAANARVFAWDADDAIRDLMPFLHVVRAYGATEKFFHLALEHAKNRSQFGQVIGKFQSISHKLADCFTQLEGVRLLLEKAADAYDQDDANWPYYVRAATVYATTSLRQVSLETQHVLGAIGYSEEHAGPRLFRLIHGDLLLNGGSYPAKAALIEWLNTHLGVLPDHDLGEKGNRFRNEVQEWLASYWSKERRAEFLDQPASEREFERHYTRAMAERDWHAISWPASGGGPGRSPLEQLAFIEALQVSDSPRAGRGDIQAHALMKYGTDEQKAFYLPKLRRGEILFCLGYSEPGAGSDLSALQTRAVRDGDSWVINGEKCWTTFAEQADYMWLAAKTDPGATPPHAGISVFIVPMNSPGLSIHPSKALYGHDFCTEFFDDVRIPLDSLVGEVNGGWKVITSALATERVQMGGFVSLIRANYQRLFEQHLACSRSPYFQAAADRLAELCAEIEVARLMVVDCVRLIEQGQVPVHEAAMSKAFTGELMERLGEVAMDVLGSPGALSEGSEGAIHQGRFEHMLRRSIMMVIGGGTAEIQRNLIAQKGLGLPR